MVGGADGHASIGNFRLNPVLLADAGGSVQSSNPLALDSLYADPVGAAPHRAAEACARAELRAWQQQNPGQAKPGGAGRAQAGGAPLAIAASASGLLHPATADGTSTVGSDAGCVSASLESAVPEGHTTVGELSRAVVGAVAAQVEEALDRAVQVRSPCKV